MKSYPCHRCNMDDGSPACLQDNRCPGGEQTKRAPVKDDNAETLQFLTDVVTAAGLLAHGKKDRALAQRMSDAAFEMRSHLLQGVDCTGNGAL